MKIDPNVVKAITENEELIKYWAKYENTTTIKLKNKIKKQVKDLQCKQSHKN